MLSVDYIAGFHYPRESEIYNEIKKLNKRGPI